MKKYVKPVIASLNKKGSVMPLAAVAGLSAAGAFAIGVAGGLMKDDHGLRSVKLIGIEKCLEKA